MTIRFPAISVALLLAFAIPLEASAQPTATSAATAQPGLAFNGLTLATALDASVVHSPDVAAARAVVVENQSALAAIRGVLGPQLVGGYVVSPQAGNNNDTITSRITSVGLQYTIGDFATFSPLVAGATANLRLAQSNEAAAERSERLKTVGLFYDALRARGVAGARKTALDAANAQLRAAQLRFNAGVAPRLDIVRANVAVARATSDFETATATDANATEALRVETAVEPAQLATIADGVAPAVLDIDPQTAVQRARATRPELKAAAQTTAAAQAAARAARFAGLPALTVGGGYAAGVDSGVNVHSPTLNVTLGLPLSGVARARALQAAAQVDESTARAQSVQRGIDLEVAAAARTFAAADRALQAAIEARTQAEVELNATQLGYRGGASSSLELSSARDAYTQALVDELGARYDAARARAILALEVGS